MNLSAGGEPGAVGNVSTRGKNTDLLPVVGNVVE